ncbi:MAG: glycosyltransferase [Phycisphaerales bacterium]|nr:MAG: glycosyltransferase [Phycisphaerales bacterium]
MPSAFIVWTVVCCLIALVWLSRHVSVSRAQRHERTLSSRSYDGAPARAPRVSVLVAAKDEEENIGDCVRSLLEQDYPDYEVIVTNDRSVDRTGAILNDLRRSSANGKLKILTVETLREGWFGKNNAMREGVAAATGEWYCFADADCRQTSRRTLSMAVREAIERGVDFLSVLPVLETRSFWERLLQPVCAGVMVFWFRPERVNDPKSRTAYANGAFMLMTRSCYDRIGGHECVKTEVNEDMHMARIAKAKGLSLRVIQNDDLYVTRMYASFVETWRGWSRIFYGCFGSFRRLAVSMLLLVTASILPWVSLIVSAIGGLVAGPSRAGPWWTVAAVSLVVVIVQQTVTFRFYRLVRSHPAWSFGYIVGAVLCLGMLINAALKLGGTTRTIWRGTAYRGDRLDTPGMPDMQNAGKP